ncbi:hypothetical protein KUV50_16900 [Membranicola marinus]|uniref:DoxX protein n=1 Tax=Membranihabitans marinus TaxID=1227546 RepID=A0A953LAE0_9BACT|nr:hypothetical protein [Membranihabitans marinus]MBY5959835.1 hypothetical protein [Membranihabitans marinus]
MTLSVLLIIITAIALFITLLNGLVFHRTRYWALSFLQSFSGVFFLISGFVKAIDPLGTSYKMTDYFHAFSKHLAGTPFQFLDGLWDLLAHHGVAVSVLVIVLELVVGFMLLIGARNKLISWVFLLLVAFFTVLTGFTYLTGYVPPEATFFEFSKWGPWVEGQMEVSDCGCFGDFLKLSPLTSFLKDIFLLIPAIVFVVFHRRMYQWWTPNVRLLATSVFTLLMLVFTYYSSTAILPLFDFRPFKEGTDVRTTKELEEQAMSEIEVLGYKLTNTITGETKEVTMDEFLKDFKKYPKSEWEYDQIKTEPTIEPTKVSDFIITGVDNSDMAYEMLQDSNFNLWVISPVLSPSGTETKIETLVRTDTVFMETDTGTRTIVSQIPAEREYEKYVWSRDVLERYKQKVLPAEKLMNELGYKTYVAIGGAGQQAVLDLNEAVGGELYMGTADEILLKTIIRSNPGFLLVRNGVILEKWHFNSFTIDDLRQTIQKQQ